MRFSSISTLIRALNIFPTNPSFLLHNNNAQLLSWSPLVRQASPRSMPTFPLLGSLFSSSSAAGKAEMSSSYPVQKSDDEWRAVLSKEQFRILREKGTESPYTGKYDTHAPASGIYACAACSAPLYKATHKFKSGCGWPAYFDSIPGAVTRHTDKTFGMTRTEIVCSNCGGHLGHVFKGEKYPTPTDERHCVNSVSLRFSEDEGAAAKV